MKYYDFSIVLRGYGNTPEEAWDDVRQDFIDDAHYMPSYTASYQKTEVKNGK